MLGVSDAAVRKAKAAGKLDGAISPDGKVIVTKAMATEWAQAQKIIRPKPGVSREAVAKKIDSLPAQEPKQPAPFDDDEDEEGEGDEEEFLEDFKNDHNVEALLAKIPVKANMNAKASFKYQSVVELAKSIVLLKEKAGLLIPKDRTTRTLFAVGAELKKSLQNMPQKVVRNIQAAQTEVEGIEILTRAINEVLEEFSQLQQRSL